MKNVQLQRELAFAWQAKISPDAQIESSTFPVSVTQKESCLLPFVCLFAHVANEDGDDDLQFLGRVGEHALSDFPHSRENSVGSCVTGARYVLAFV